MSYRQPRGLTGDIAFTDGKGSMVGTLPARRRPPEPPLGFKICILRFAFNVDEKQRPVHILAFAVVSAPRSLVGHTEETIEQCYA